MLRGTCTSTLSQYRCKASASDARHRGSFAESFTLFSEKHFIEGRRCWCESSRLSLGMGSRGESCRQRPNQNRTLRSLARNTTRAHRLLNVGSHPRPTDLIHRAIIRSFRKSQQRARFGRAPMNAKPPDTDQYLISQVSDVVDNSAINPSRGKLLRTCQNLSLCKTYKTNSEISPLRSGKPMRNRFDDAL